MTFSNDASQKFTSIINEERYEFLVIYNPTFEYWTMGISKEGITLADGIKLVTQTLLLSQYANIPFDLISTHPNDANRDNITLFTLDLVNG